METVARWREDAAREHAAHPCQSCGTPTVATCIPGRDDDDPGDWYRWCVDGCGRTVAFTPAAVTR